MNQPQYTNHQRMKTGVGSFLFHLARGNKSCVPTKTRKQCMNKPQYTNHPQTKTGAGSFLFMLRVGTEAAWLPKRVNSV